jgi:PAS domain S-box-containing protein
MLRHLSKTTVSKNYVDGIFHAMTNSLIVLDAEGLIRTVNVSTLRLLGYQENELIGHPFSLIAEDALSAVLKKNMDIDKLETLYRAKNGHELPVLFSSSKMDTSSGESQAVVCLALDISDKKQIEKEKDRLEKQLRQAHKMEAIGTLAGGIAHDFNNILTVILGYTDLAKYEVQPGSKLASDLDHVQEAGTRAKDLVKQILAFSRQDDTECIPLRPANLVREAIKILRPSLPTTIEINHNIDPKTSLICVDPTKIHQILMNLCTNAFQAMEETGGRLDISLKDIDLSSADLVHEPHVKAGSFVQLSVRDTGTGIAPEIKDKIFDPYFTTKEIGKGTGMGLSIVHGIVKSYGGFVTLESECGKGSAFHVFLPVLKEEMLSEHETAEPIPIGRERILFIDDEKAVAELAKDMLERLGYQVVIKTNSLEALVFFQNQPDRFDLVITDQTMPGMTGADLARRMIQIRPNIPIILCTGYSAIMSENKAKSLGIREFAYKPLTKKDMAKLIRKVLDKKN